MVSTVENFERVKSSIINLSEVSFLALSSEDELSSEDILGKRVKK